MSARPIVRRAGAALAVTLAAVGLPALPATAAPAVTAVIASTEVTEDELSGDLAYPGNPVTEPALVADEEERLSQVRTVASMIRWRGLDVTGPYRLSTGSTYTLVLTKRDEPYGIADLLVLAPQTFVREPDGAYLLTENIVTQPGAVLQLQDAGPLTIHLASDASRFVSIVNLGGELVTRGTSAAPVTVTSWDRDAGAPDLLTDDGRAYVRSVGGQVDLSGTTFADLGFWSGRTGGVALTGSDLPSAGMLDEFGRQLRDAVDADAPEQPLSQEQQRAAEDAAAEAGLPAPQDETEEEEAAESAPVEGLLPAGELPVPEGDLEDPSYSYVSARIEDSVFQRNAFGLFISSANGVDVSRATVEDSLVDGLVMHRFVVNASISETVSRGNAGDGVILARATTGIILSEVEASENGGSGIVVRGEPLADGPNATGMPVGDYGNNSIANSTAKDNGRYGIEVVGGRNVDVSANDVERNDMGIVVRDGAREVSLIGNRLTDNVRHAIALRDGVADAIVSGNVVAGAINGLYLRDSAALVERNTMSGLTNHAVTLIGAAEGTELRENTFAGRGPSAVDRKRAEGVVVGENDVDGWESTKPFWTVVRNALQPLTVLWISLALIVVITAARGARHRSDLQRRHPYGAQRRLSELTSPPVVLESTATAATAAATARHGRRTAGSVEEAPESDAGPPGGTPDGDPRVLVGATTAPAGDRSEA